MAGLPGQQCDRGCAGPAQAWNALTVGAFTDKVTFSDSDGSREGFVPLASKGDISPYSTTTLVDWDKAWPIKPEIVCEGGTVPGRLAARSMVMTTWRA